MKPLLRFAPSPTGPFHLGGLRTALFNHLFAKKNGGRWILRIEDTDKTRFIQGSVESIRRGLEWAGIQYDFGPGVGGPHAPYFQSERLELYRAYANRLLDSGDAYRCFCTIDELEDKKKQLREAGSTSTYDRACRKLSDEEVARRVRAKQRHTIRIDDSIGPSLPYFSDMIFGEVRDARGSLPTDPILLKVDGFPTYHLASVVDDHEMGITHVFRGEEWLPSLPLHRSLYSRLKLTEPTFGHLPLLLNPDGSKMSKRHGNTRVQDYEDAGWDPDAVVNWLAVAGRNTNDPDLSSLSPSNIKQLIEGFDLRDYTKRRAVLDPLRLTQLNKGHLQYKLEDNETRHLHLQRAREVIQSAYPTIPTFSDEYIEKVLMTLGDRLERTNQLPEIGRIFFEGRSNLAGPLPCKENDYTVVIRTFSNWVKDASDLTSVSGVFEKLSVQHGIPKRMYLAVIRHALGGEKTGPPLAQIVSILGKGTVLERLEMASRQPNVEK
ncbi:glutamyl-tRNA synthetase, partial [Serendipita vermifera]